jgi:DNA replication protein DnaC
MSGPALTEAAKQVRFAARELKTPVVAEVFDQIADQARADGWTFEEYLAAVLGRQTAVRGANSVKARVGAAKFPQVKTMEDFDFAHLPTAPRDLIAHLGTATFIAKADNVILLGPPGVGKTHLAIALGRQACHAGWRVTFDSATGWVAHLAAAHRDARLDAELKRLDRYRLLIIDELGYLPFDAEAAALFFQLVAHRYERGAIMITSNLSFARWGETLGDEVVAAATIDRLVHHAHVIAIDGESYRTRNHRQAKENTK